MILIRGAANCGGEISARRRKLYALAWQEFDLIKAGELVALSALELAPRDRYAARAPKRGRQPATLEGLLR